MANEGGNSVTQIDEGTGALVRVLSDPSYGFDGPYAVSTDGTRVWVANDFGHSVTEFPEP